MFTEFYRKELTSIKSKEESLGEHVANLRASAKTRRAQAEALLKEADELDRQATYFANLNCIDPQTDKPSEE